MTYKRQIDRLPIVPKDAREFNVTCHYCIVGCGYKAYTWPTNKQGGTGPGQNKFGVDLSKQQPAETAAWYAPSMYNIVQQNGEDVHIVIKPDSDCVVNSGLGSVRGARIAEMSFSRARNTQLQRLTSQWSGGTGRCSQPAGTMRSILSRALPSRSSTNRAKTACSSRRSTMAERAADMRIPGAPASFISGP